MQTATVLIFAALAFSCALTGYVFAARSRGWPVGKMFMQGTIPTYVGIACIVCGVWLLIASVLHGEDPWWILIIGIGAYFIGGSIAMAIFGRYSGMLSLIAAPVFTLSAFVV